MRMKQPASSGLYEQWRSKQALNAIFLGEIQRQLWAPVALR
jgi:hypothetical protein